MTVRLLPLLLLAALPVVALASGEAGTSPASDPTPRMQCFGDDFRTRVERGIAGYADVVNIPGISFGIVRGGALVHSGGIGYADRSAKQSATTDTPYNIASITKVFTATLAMMLVDDGTLDLDTPVSSYLPVSVRMPRDTQGAAITVRSLLTHTSGLPRDPPNRRNQAPDGPLDPGIWEAYNVSDLYAGLATTRLEAEVGKAFNYSNYGYALLGHVVERVAGHPYEQVLRERLLAPLAMSSTAVSLSAAQQRQLAAFYWTEDTARNEQTTHARFGEVAGFIGLTSTVRDLANFVAAQLEQADTARNPVPQRVVTPMQHPRLVIEGSATSKNEMGFAWFLVTDKRPDAQTILTHTGEVDGHSSGVFLNPSEDIGVVLLQNLGGDDGATAIDYLGFWLIELASKEQRSCRPSR